MLRSLAASVALAATCAAGCSNNTPVHAVFGPAGGSLSNGSATLTIPPGALASETTITMTPAPGIAAPDGTLQVGTPQILAPEGQVFDSPVTLEMTFDPSRLAGHAASEIAVYTAAVGSTAYSTLVTALVDAKHVSAQTIHFSVFQPAVPLSENSTTTGGSTGTGGKTTGSTGTTTRGTTGGRTSGKSATGSSSGGSSTGTASGTTSGGTGTTGTTSGGEPPDAGPDGGEADGGPDAGETDAGPQDAGINSGGTATCSSGTACIGAGGCVAIAIDSLSNGTASCNNPFLAPTDATGSIGNGGFLNPPATPATPALDVASNFWSVEIDLPCCPATTGTMAVSAAVNWSAGGAACSGNPKGTGTLDVTEIDDGGGLVGTFTVSVLDGMNGSFSFPATNDAAFCDAGQAVLPPSPVDIEDAGADAGTADCAADLDCLGPDAGGLSGTGSFWLNPGASADGTWCNGPLDDLASAVSISGVAAPTLTMTYDSDFFELQAALPCCPAGPGTLEASSITLESNVCGSTAGQLSPMVSAGTGTVTFTQTDGGLVGSIHLDGTTEADATFSIP